MSWMVACSAAVAPTATTWNLIQQGYELLLRVGGIEHFVSAKLMGHQCPHIGATHELQTVAASRLSGLDASDVRTRS